MNRNINNGNNIEQARFLVRAFMEGATDPRQEQWLYGFFGASAPGTLPPDLEAMRPMFGWYASLQPTARHRKRSNYRLAAIAAAAVLLLGLGAFGGFMMRRPHNATEGAYSEYCGSYIIRNGQRCDEMPVIYNDIVAAERFADSLTATATDSLAIEQALRSITDADCAAELRNQIFY